MKVAVSMERRFLETPDGTVWTSSLFPYSFWQRYLSVFDEVQIVSRVKQASRPEADWKRVSGPGVSFAKIPHYVGPWQFFKCHREITQVCRNVLMQDAALICRVGSPLAEKLIKISKSQNRPYSLEVVGDPYDAFAPEANDHPFRAYFRQHLSRELKFQCRSAAAVAYVTKSALQKRYPPGDQTFHTSYSSIELSDEAYVSSSREFLNRVGRLRLVTVASLAHTQKGVDVILDAMAACVSQGLNLQLTIVGDGRFRHQYEQQTQALNLTDSVTFTGELPGGAAVRDQLDSADVFVLPTRHEGLPRSVLEAMSRALPCVSTTVGGIPEILASSEMVKPNNAGQLAEKLKELAGDSKRMTELSARNLKIARQYHNNILTKRRNEFYETVKKITHSQKRSVAA